MSSFRKFINWYISPMTVEYLTNYHIRRSSLRRPSGQFFKIFNDQPPDYLR